jgi:hypothetical protein
MAWIFEVRRNWAPYFLAGAIVILALVIVLLVIIYRAQDTAATDTTTVASGGSTSTSALAVLPTDPTTSTTIPATTSSVTTTTVAGKLPATVTLSGLSATYTGSPVQVGVQTDPDGLIVIFTYRQGDTPVESPIDAGTYMVTAIIDDAQYQGTAVGTLEIRKADARINVSGWSGTYTGTAHQATGSAIGVRGETLSSLLTVSGRFTDVPGGVSNWSFAGNTNYNPATGSVGIVITKARADISVSGWNGVYDGNPHGAVLNYARGVLGENLSSLVTLGARTYTSPPGGPVGWNFLGDRNYFSAGSSVSITITKANATIKVSGWSGEYDGFSHGATGSATGVKGENLSGFLNLGESYVNAPGGTAHWTFKPNPYNPNYYDDFGSVSIEITEPPTTTTDTTEAPPTPG